MSEAAADTPALQASGSSFYAGMRILPKPRRQAMYAVYAFCRAADDIADAEERPRSERRADLDAWRGELEDLFKGGRPPRAGFLHPHVARYDLRLEDFLAVVDGMQMDADGAIVAPPFEVLDLYCDRVASAVGRLSVRIFGMPETRGRELAHHLGRALQITNILRDLDEDADAGRLYMAREWLEAAGVGPREPHAVLADARFDAAARRAAQTAREHYAAADAVLRTRPGGRLAAPRLMSAVYGEILDGMEKEGWAAPRRRISLSKGRLLYVLMVRGILGL